MLYILYTVFLQYSESEKRRYYCENPKGEKIHLQCCTIFIYDNLCISGTVQFKPVLFKVQVRSSKPSKQNTLETMKCTEQAFCKKLLNFDTLETVLMLLYVSKFSLI